MNSQLAILVAIAFVTLVVVALCMANRRVTTTPPNEEGNSTNTRSSRPRREQN